MKDQIFSLNDLIAFISSRNTAASPPSVEKKPANDTKTPLSLVRIPGLVSETVRRYDNKDAALRSCIDGIHRDALQARTEDKTRSADKYASKLCDERLAGYLSYRLGVKIPKGYFQARPTVWSHIRYYLLCKGHGHFAITGNSNLPRIIEQRAAAKAKGIIRNVWKQLQLVG